MLCNPKIDATENRAKRLLGGHTSLHQADAPLEAHFTARCLKYWASLSIHGPEVEVGGFIGKLDKIFGLTLPSQSFACRRPGGT